MQIEIACVPLAGVVVLLWLPVFIPSVLRRRLTDPTRLSFPTFVGMASVWTNWWDLLRGAAGAYLLATAVFFSSSGETGKPSGVSKPDVVSASVTNEADHMSKTNAMLVEDENKSPDTSSAGDSAKTNAMVWKVVMTHKDSDQTAMSKDPAKAKTLPLRIVLIQLAVLGVGLLIQTVRLRRNVTLKATFFAPIFYACGITLGQSDFLIGAAGVAVGWLISLAAKSPIYQLPVMVVALGVAGFLLNSFSLMLFAGLVLLPIMMGLLWQKRLVYVSHGHSALHKGQP